MRHVYIAVLNQVPFLPYIYGLLRVYAEEDPDVRLAYQFEEPIFLMQSPAEIAARIQPPAVLGLSCYVWNFQKHMKIARLCKEQNPDMLVVAGGPHIPERVGSFFAEHPYVDLLVHNEGEIAFQRILKEALSPVPDWSRIPGISFVVEGKVVQTCQGEKLPREISLPSPFLAGYLDGSIAACRERNLRFYAPWETNRGCPYSCSFCDWGSNTMSLMRKFSDTRIAQEIEFFGREQIPNVFICDANFGILPRDLGIGQALARTHQTYGFPLQVRVNFAKNSNDRVFAISKVWSENDMLMGTTLSMQSTSLEVLEAIDRKNIGVERYQALKERYAQAGIPTYTELILGLPLETKTSFKQGLGLLLEAGNHDDIRVYEFVILPNAPINQPEILDRFGIRTVEKQMYLEPEGASPDEIEKVPLVVETEAMSRADWVDCALFSQMIQILHNGCYTRYLSIHLHQQYGLPYYTFYDRLQQTFLAKPDTVLGLVLSCLRDLYQRYLADPHMPQVNLIASQPEMVAMLDGFGRRRGWMVDNWGWLSIATRQEDFYEQIGEFVRSLGLSLGDEMPDLLRYQSDLMLKLDYDPRQGKIAQYAYNFPAYFAGAPLEAQPIRIHFRDTHMGVNRQYPLEKGNPRSFAKAAIGESYPFVRIRHYQHQLDAAEIAVLVV